MDAAQDNTPQVSTQDYIDAIKEAKANGRALSINYGSLPDTVVASAIHTAMADGLPQEYQDAIGEAASKGKTISLDFSQISKPQAAAPSTWDKIKQAATNAVSIEQRPGLPQGPAGMLQQYASQLKDAALSPVPGSLLRLPIDAVSQASGQAGADIARGLQPKIGTGLARTAGLAASAALDPYTYAGGGLGADAAKVAAQKTIQETAPAIMRVFSDTPEAATKLGLASEDALKGFGGTTPEIEGAVQKLQQAIKDTRATVGKRIGDARDSLGFNRDLQTRATEMAQGMSNLYPTKEAVAQGFLDLQQQLPKLSEKDALAKLYELRISADALQKASAFSPTATTSAEGGTLKNIAGAINDKIATYPKGQILRKLDSAYSQASNTYESLQNLLKDPGKGEDMLRRIFTGDRGTDREIRKRLATVEAVTGKPVMQNLFKQFAAQELNRTIGRPGAVGAGATAMLGGLGTVALGHPLIGATELAAGGAAILGQSPKLMMGAARALPTAAQIPGAAIGATAGAMGSSVAQSPTTRSQRLLDLLRQKARSY